MCTPRRDKSLVYVFEEVLTKHSPSLFGYFGAPFVGTKGRIGTILFGLEAVLIPISISNIEIENNDRATPRDVETTV